MKRLALALLLFAGLAQATSPFSLPLLVNASATGSAMYWPGGWAEFAVEGTFSGATVTLEQQGPALSTTYIPAGTACTLTAVGNCTAYMGAGLVKVIITGGPPSGIYATLSTVLN